MDPFKNELPENWKEALPVEMQSSGVLATATTIEALAKMAIDGRNLANTALRIPTEDASDDAKASFRTDLMEKMPDLMFKPQADDAKGMKEIMAIFGAPSTVDGYKIDSMPESIKGNMSKVADSALKANLTSDQFDIVTAGILADYKEGSDANMGAMTANVDALKTKWGGAYDSKVARVKHFAKQTGFSEEFVTSMEAGKVSESDMLAFDKVIDGFDGEGINLGVDPNGVNTVMPPAEAEAAINDIMGNKQHAYWKPMDPAHQAAVDKVVDLGRMIETGKKNAA